MGITREDKRESWTIDGPLQRDLPREELHRGGWEVWSLMEHDLDNYIEEHGQHVGEAEVEVEDDFAQHSGIGGSSYQDDGASSSHYGGGATQWPTWD